MSVRIRLKKLGRRHRPFYRLCAVDRRRPRDGRVLEELGTYDPMVPDVDARAVLDGERIAYWLGVGAQPTEKVAVLIRKYGKGGSHLEQQKTALERLAQSRTAPPIPEAPAAKPKEETKEEPAAATEQTPAPETPAPETPAPEAPAAEAPAPEAPAAEAPTEEKSE